MTPERYPLVSILIPNYNYVQYVGTAVESALAQTYPNVEVIVSDNCSTDGAWELLNEKFGSDPRVRLYQNERNVGMAVNFDRLLARARGHYILCLSSDDFLLPQHVARLEEVFARDPQLDVVYCTSYFAHENGEIYSVRALAGQFPVDYVDARDELVEELTTVCPVCFPCALFKADALLEPGICGEAENGQTARDWEVIIRLALAGKRFAYVAQPSMAIRLHADQHTGDEYHRSGRNVVDYAAYVERYIDHPEFVRRMRGRELGVARLLGGLVAQTDRMNGGVSPFDDAERAQFVALDQRLQSRAALYEPGRVRESTVSVVVQTAGGIPPLLRALDSVAAQRFPNWELVVVDHGEMPVEAVLRAHPAWDRISHVRLPAQRSAGYARNLGLRMIRGEYVAFLEADNALAPDHLERAVETILRTGAKGTVATARLALERASGMASQAQALGEVAPFGGDERDLVSLAYAHAIPLDALVVYRGVLDTMGPFNESVPILEDWEFLLRVAQTTSLACTGATTVDVTARLHLTAQRLGSALGSYLGSLDALYAAHPVDAQTAARRAGHRADVATALASAGEWIADPRGLAAFMCALAGRSAFVTAE